MRGGKPRETHHYRFVCMFIQAFIPSLFDRTFPCVYSSGGRGKGRGGWLKKEEEDDDKGEEQS